MRTVDSPIQQGLANENSDADAIYRLIFPLQLNFKNDDKSLSEKELGAHLTAKIRSDGRMPSHCYIYQHIVHF